MRILPFILLLLSATYAQTQDTVVTLWDYPEGTYFLSPNIPYFAHYNDTLYTVTDMYTYGENNTLKHVGEITGLQNGTCDKLLANDRYVVSLNHKCTRVDQYDRIINATLSIPVHNPSQEIQDIAIDTSGKQVYIATHWGLQIVYYEYFSMKTYRENTRIRNVVKNTATNTLAFNSGDSLYIIDDMVFRHNRITGTVKALSLPYIRNLLFGPDNQLYILMIKDTLLKYNPTEFSVDTLGDAGCTWVESEPVIDKDMNLWSYGSDYIRRYHIPTGENDVWKLGNYNTAKEWEWINYSINDTKIRFLLSTNGNVIVPGNKNIGIGYEQPPVSIQTPKIHTQTITRGSNTKAYDILGRQIIQAPGRGPAGFFIQENKSTIKVRNQP